MPKLPGDCVGPDGREDRYRTRVQFNCSRHGHPNLAEAPSVIAKKFYYDTVCYASKPVFICALEAFGADHLVTGSDYPILQDYEAYKETFAYIERLALSKSDTDKILHHNAQALFGFDH
jgi:predicted TIM-barrel fold metal-dependent hydrolase